MNNTILQAADLISDAQFLVIATGAGMGVDCGLSTFRGRNATVEKDVWPPIAQDRETPYGMAKERRFKNEPFLTWGYFDHRARVYENTVPHEGYHILTEWAKKVS